MSVSWDVGELNALAASLAASAVRVTGETQQVVAKSGLALQADAQALAPSLTGTLRGSIKADIGALVATVGPTVDYGGYVEYGTSDTAPQPYMGPALDKNADPFVADLEEVTDGLL